MPNIFKKTYLFFLGLGLFLVPKIVLAVDDVFTKINSNLGDLQGTANLPKGASSPLVIVSNIINTVLGLLGLIFIILLIYAGFKMMFARGDAEAVEKATKTIRQAVIGVAIIILAFVISIIVFNIITNIVIGNSAIVE